MQPNLFQHRPQRIVRVVWCRQKKIIAQRSAEQVHTLGHDADRFTQGRFAKIRQRKVVKPNLALLRVPGAREELQKRRFATSRTAKDRNALPGINRKADVFQRVLRLLVVGEGDVAERQRDLLRHSGLTRAELHFRLLLCNIRNAQRRGNHLAEMLKGAGDRG